MLNWLDQLHWAETKLRQVHNIESSPALYFHQVLPREHVPSSLHCEILVYGSNSLYLTCFQI